MYVCLARKTTAIPRIAVRETDISRHHEDLIEGPLKSFGPSEYYGIEGLKGGGLNFTTIMPSNASLSDSWCKFSQSGRHGLGMKIQQAIILLPYTTIKMKIRQTAESKDDQSMYDRITVNYHFFF